MQWSGRSFMLDIKPRNCYASLFVSCPYEGKRDLIRILKDGIELATANTESDEVLDQIIESKSDSPAAEKRTSLKALVDGFFLHPDTVTNYSWTDDQLTFSCKIRVERLNTHELVPRNVKDALLQLTKDFSMDQFCQQTSEHVAAISCRQCGRSLLKDDAKVTRAFNLPSSNLNEVADEWFCCATHQHSGSGCQSYVCARNASVSPDPHQCFIGDWYLLLNANVVDGVCFTNDPKPIMCCNNCKTELGAIDASQAKSTISGKEALRFYHSAVELIFKNGDTQLNYLSLRFRTLERYFAWLLLSECEAQSSLKFALKTLDNHPTMLLWLLDPFSVMVSGQLSDPWKDSSPSKPFPILKLLYKTLDDSNISDPRVTGQDASVGMISMPRKTCTDLTNFLQQSSASLPPACRPVGKFSVGYIHMGPCI